MMDHFDVLLERWELIAGVGSLVISIVVLWLTANFPRRKEYEAGRKVMERRMDALEQQMSEHKKALQQMPESLDAIKRQMTESMDGIRRQMTESMDGIRQQVAGNEKTLRMVAETVNIMNADIKGLNEKFHWRLNGLENQTSLLIRGHLDFEEKD
jgi:chromosome segregation ATPase